MMNLSEFPETKLRNLPEWGKRNFTQAKVSAQYKGMLSGYQKAYFGKNARMGILGYTLEYPHLIAHEANAKNH
eukprot:Nk52_evm1s745 gene=Nk52_evmTU1s745